MDPCVGVGLSARHGYDIYDALVIATALEAECATLYSEDVHDGQTIDGQPTIRSPFAKSSGNELFSRVMTLY
jgi:predicted nucleic acid-binding protein